MDLCLCGWWSYVALTGRRGVVFLRTCCSFSSSSSFLFPICSSHHPPGPSSAQAVSGHLHSEALPRCPAPLWTHRSYLGVRSPGGRSSRQSAWNRWPIMRMLLYFWVTLAVMKNPFIKEVNAGMLTWRPPAVRGQWPKYQKCKGTKSQPQGKAEWSMQNARLRLLLWHSNSKPVQREHAN